MRKVMHKVRTTNDQIDTAIVRAKEFELIDLRVVAARYHSHLDLVSLDFADGSRFSIPRMQLQGLGDANRSQLAQIKIVGNGTGLHWPLLDVDHYVPGLLQHRFGTQRWMKEIGRRGGSVKTKVKAEAARANGLRGGRPKVLTRNSLRADLKQI